MSAEAPHRFRAKAYPRVRHSAVTTYYSPRATHRLLPETPNRVETHVSHRKQTIGYPSTRDSSRLEFAPFSTGNLEPWSSNLQLLPSNFENLIGTRERLETRVSYRKQSTACTSNRYRSRHMPGAPLGQISNLTEALISLFSHSPLTTSHYRKAVKISILRGLMDATPEAIRWKGPAR